MVATQPDLFGEVDVDPTPVEPARRYGDPPHPNPFDGLVHAISEVKADKGARTIVVKCGARMPTYRVHETIGGASVWGSEVTCPPCRESWGLPPL